MNGRAVSLSTLLVGIFLFSCSTEQSAMRVTEPQQAAPSPDDYRLAPEDVIGVLVWREEDLSQEVAVRPDGKVSLPLVGDIPAAGLTTGELKTNIEKSLSEYIEEPTVSVTVLQTNSMRFFVQGEVAQPGAYDLKSNYTVIQAISLAGGFTEWAQKDKIVIFRKDGDQAKRIPINYENITSGKDSSQNVVLMRGDTIVVP